MRVFLGSAEGCVAFVLVAAVVVGVAFRVLSTCIMAWTQGRPWWPRALPRQRRLMMNFGYTREAADDATCLAMYSYVLLICSHYLLCAAAMLPVVFYGWEAAGARGQLAFILGVLFEAAFDTFDWVKQFLLLIFPRQLRFLGPPCPAGFFVVMCGLHHPLSMVLAVPMCLYYPSLRAFHLIAVSLLLAAGSSYLLGAYKYTLDTDTKCGLLQYKAIVLLSLMAIWLTRGLVWFTEIAAALSAFLDDGAIRFLVAGSVLAALMSIFNLVCIVDVTLAVVRWIAKPMPVAERTMEEGQPTAEAQEPKPEPNLFWASLRAARACGHSD